MPADVLDEELESGIKKAKRGLCNFALITKGPKPVKLIVRRKPILDGEVNKAKAEFKGNDVTVGVVIAEGADYVFRALEIPSVKEQAVKEFIAEQTDIKCKARFEQVTALPTVEDTEDPPLDPSSDAPVTTPVSGSTSTSGSPTTGVDEVKKAELKLRLKELVGKSSQVLAVAPGTRDEIMSLAAVAKESIKTDNFPQAEIDLDKFAQFLKVSLSPPTDLPPSLPPSLPPTDLPPPLPNSGPTIPPPNTTGAPTLPPVRGGAPTFQPRTGGPTATRPTGTAPPLGPKQYPPKPGLVQPVLPPKLPGMYFRKGDVPLFTFNTGPRNDDQLAMDKFIEENIDAIFGDAKDEGSAELDKWNETLTKRGVNDAETTRSATSAKELNCSFCTIGALLGKTSSEISIDRQKKAGVTNPDPKQQEMTIWGNPTADPGKADAATSDFNAQISPMKDMAKSFCDDSGGKYELVDSLKLVDDGGVMVPETFDEKALIGDMKKLPNGTRYSVYMKGSTPAESHWCYAEKRNDFIIFRDYQQSIQVPPQGRGATATPAFVTGPGITVDQLPLGPRVGNKIFFSGTFFAIKPKV